MPVLEPLKVPESVARFRSAFRAENDTPRYNGWAHFTMTSVFSLAAIAWCVAHISKVRPVEWLVLPAGFVFANFVEWVAHKGPMHRPKPGAKILYVRHTQEHHHFFTHEAMAFESPRDFKMVLFPAAMIVFFLGLIATPLSALLYFVLTPNVGFLMGALSASYFLTYEWLHFAYHVPTSGWVGGVPFVAALRGHHMRHHDLALMGKYNFNVTFPLFDLLCGTFHRGRAKHPRDAVARAQASHSSSH